MPTRPRGRTWRSGAVLVFSQDAGRADDEVELALEREVRDQRLVSVDSGVSLSQVLEHAWMSVDSYQLDSSAVQRDCYAPGPDTQIEHRRLRGSTPAEPRNEVHLVRQRRVESGEPRVRVERIVADSHLTGIAQLPRAPAAAAFQAPLKHASAGSGVVWWTRTYTTRTPASSRAGGFESRRTI